MMELDGDDIIICGGSAKPTDWHLLSKVVAVDAEIFEWLERREKRKTPPKLDDLVSSFGRRFSGHHRA
jgi:hypothetical protein